MLKSLCIIPLLFASLPDHAVTQTAKIPHGTVELIPAVNSIQPGATFRVGFLFKLEPGWHIYWKNPGDSGQPPRLQWQLADGLTAGEIEWPVPKRLPVGPLMDYGYEDEVLLPVSIQAPVTLPSAPQELKVNMRVLVCRETCIPGKAALSLNLPVRKGPAQTVKENQEFFAKSERGQPKQSPPSWKISAQQSSSSVNLTLEGVPNGTKFNFFPAHPGVIENAAPQQVNTTANGSEIVLKKSADASGRPSSLEGLLVVGQSGGNEAYSISPQLSPPAATPSGQGKIPGAAAASSPGLLAVLLLAFGGGLILNLMPCVFPVLSIKVLSLLEHAAGERKLIRLSSVAYTVGVIISFWILVALLLGLRGAGRSLGWGFQLQSPGFVAFLICLLFVLGLSLLGTFEIGASAMNLGSGLTGSSKYSNSFFTGVLATVVATPCTAPLMGVAVGYALSQSALICLLVFTAMALGLAAPFLLLAFFPHLSKLLPRPGAWMETLKQVMAFPVFLTVIWLLWVVGQQVGINQLIGILATLLLLSVAAWVAGRWPMNTKTKILAAALGIVITIFCSAVLRPVNANSLSSAASQSGGLKWEAFTPEKVASYRSAGKPVLIDFTAAWCLTCQVNDRVVFHSPQVEKRLNQSDIALLRADWTSYDPTITAWLAKFGRSGIPFYVIYGAQPNSAPVTLPDGILTPSAFLQTLSSLNL